MHLNITIDGFGILCTVVAAAIVRKIVRNKKKEAEITADVMKDPKIHTEVKDGKIVLTLEK